MSGNMPLEALLEELARWGYVSLNWKWGKWICSVRIPDHADKYGQPYREAHCETPTEACETVWQLLEDMRASGELARCRAKAVEDYEAARDRYDKADTYARSGFDPVRNPDPLGPERPLPRGDA